MKKAKKYYVPWKLQDINEKYQSLFPAGCKNVICVFTNKRAMQKYYGKNVKYMMATMPEGSSDGTEEKNS